MRSLELPLRLDSVEAELGAKPELGGYVGEQLGNLGGLGRELAAGARRRSGTRSSPSLSRCARAASPTPSTP